VCIDPNFVKLFFAEAHSSTGLGDSQLILRFDDPWLCCYAHFDILFTNRVLREAAHPRCRRDAVVAWVLGADLVL